MKKLIEFLLNNADPSIILRIKKEILNCLSKKEEEELLNKIILQKNIQTVIKSQKTDGWIRNSFHRQGPTHGAGIIYGII